MFLKITGIRGCTFALQRGAKHSPPSRNAGRPFGQKSTLSHLVGFLRFIQLGSEVYMVPLSQRRHVLSINLTSFQFVQMFLKITGIRGGTFALQRGAKHSPPSQNAGRPPGQKSTLSDLVGFLKFIQLGSQVYNGAVESASHASIGAN